MRFVVLVFALLFSLPCWAYELTPQDETAIREKTELAKSSYEKGDFDTLLSLTHPKAIEIFGGQENMKKVITAAMERHKELKLSFESAQYGKITAPVTSKDNIFCFLPTDTIMKVGDKRVHSISYMIAIKPIAGGDWKLLDGSGLRNDKTLINLFFPDFPADAQLPENKTDVLK